MGWGRGAERTAFTDQFRGGGGGGGGSERTERTAFTDQIQREGLVGGRQNCFH